jgi:hypothetical protein
MFYNLVEEKAVRRHLQLFASERGNLFLFFKTYFEKKIKDCLLFHVFQQTTGSISFQLEMRELY